MAHLSVRNFGPIQELELEIQDFMVLIGPNGSGKSTIAKLVYLFREVPKIYEENLFFLLSNRQPFNEMAYELHTAVYAMFSNFFGYQERLKDDFRVSFKYNSGLIISLYLNQERQFRIDAGEAYTNLELFDFLANNRKNPIDLWSPLNNSNVTKRVEAIFSWSLYQKMPRVEYPNRFIPAQRGRILPFGKYRSDYWVKRSEFNGGSASFLYDEQYTERLSSLLYNPEGTIKDINRSILDVLDEYPPMLPEVQKVMQLAMKEQVAKFFKGGFEAENGTLSIVLADRTKVPISHISSGEQEAFGVLVDLVDIVLKASEIQAKRLPGERDRSCALIIEEPESSLFPIHQKNLTEAIAIAFNAIQGNQVLITTHSPYIITALNNLLTAHDIATEYPELKEQVAAIIPETLWVDPAQVGAYHVEHGTISSILSGNNLVIADKIDTASDDIGDVFDALIRLQLDFKRKQYA